MPTAVSQEYISGNGRDTITKGTSLRTFRGKAEVIDITSLIEENYPREEKTVPEKLYKLPEEGQFDIPKIIGIRQVTKELIDHLDEALETTDDEIARENIMACFAEEVFKLNKFLKMNENFKDAICLLETVIIAQYSSVYNRNKIWTLKKVLDLMRNNIFMSEDTSNRCFDLLEEAGFNLNAPMGEVDFGV